MPHAHADASFLPRPISYCPSGSGMVMVIVMGRDMGIVAGDMGIELGSGPARRALRIPPFDLYVTGQPRFLTEISQRLAAVVDLALARPPPSRAALSEALQALAGICLRQSGASP
jgi:hypothetical protein